MENSKTGRKTNKRGASNFLVQGIILAAAGIIVRIIGMFYRIPLADILGDEGNGYYSSAFSIYSILLIVSSYSLPTAVSKMVAVRLARKEYINSIKVLKVSLFYGTVVGGLGAAVLWFGADLFANDFLKMPYTSYALKTLAPTILIIAYLGVFRGYFQGIGTMLPTAISQIFEQIVNAVISIYAAAMLFQEGVRSNALYGSTQYSYAFGAAGGTIGTGAGALAGLLFLLFILFSYRPVMKRQSRRDRSGYLETYGSLSTVLIMTVLPIVFSSVAYNISIVVDNSIYGISMASMGMGAPEIAANWGIYSGKYRLLFNIPVAIANSLASALIPSLSQAVAERSRTQIIRKISMVIRFSMIIAIPSTVGLTVLAGPICNLLFSRSDNVSLIKMMIYGSSAVVFFSLSTVTNAVLQGINHMKTPLKNAIISLILHVGILWVMLYPLKMGIYGVLYSNILFALTMCLLNGFSIRRYLNYRQEIKKTFFLPTLAAGIMGAVCYGVYFLVHAVLKHNILGVLASVAAAVIVYGVLLLKFQCVDESELNGFPGGRKLAGIARKYHLL
ncbi:putative polysaccharide biosynthesis protein [Lacrimispora defluvii]|uniref:Polysaccharide biosynthesis protein n=1 Tax=Lacrimispora defluvii TaxID=2719233 RepID=A0ABX1VS36_9FIRM|nr:polysaccharide biosynthesis protein [Lacrimispora defluvii]NNJ29116.1 polysaccharide biosynthesis protein [Lacrimispora defluvii]